MPVFQRWLAGISGSKGRGMNLSGKKKILVLESEKLLAASIVSLLASQSELDVMNTNIGTLESWDKSSGARPDVVIMEEGLLAANISAIVKLAERHPKLRLIVFGLSNGDVQIFDKQMARVRHVSDFLSLL
jgi:DNA-binding NarL/FixJ family response regulator